MTTNPITFKNDIATKQFHVPSRWEMFTKKGDHAVKKIATDLANCAVSMDTPESRLPCFKTFVENHDRLAKLKNTSEIDDTAVQESVSRFITDIAVETGVDPRIVNGIFFHKNKPVDNWNCSNPEIKKKYWWSCNPKPV